MMGMALVPELVHRALMMQALGLVLAHLPRLKGLQ